MPAARAEIKADFDTEAHLGDAAEREPAGTEPSGEVRLVADLGH